MRLSHYVFSSLGGYRALYVSQTMPPGIVPALESFARGVYLAAQRREILAWLRSDDGLWCAAKAFPNGADHVGRSRSCVHAIVCDPDEVAGHAFFSILSLPSKLFLSAESSLQSVANELVARFDPPVPVRPSFGEGVTKDCVSALLSLMLSPEAGATVIDASGEALRIVRSLAWVLPPTVREQLTVSAWAELPPHERFAPARLVVLDGPPSDGGRTERKFVLKFPLREGENPVPFNSYAEYVASNLGSEASFQRVRKLAALVERYPPSTPFTQPKCRRLMEAFARVEVGLDGAGDIHPRRYPLTSLAAVRDFALAGMGSAALDILQTVVSSIKPYSESGTLQEALSRLGESSGFDEERFAEGCGFLADRLREFLQTQAGDEAVGD